MLGGLGFCEVAASHVTPSRTQVLDLTSVRDTAQTLLTQISEAVEERHQAVGAAGLHRRERQFRAWFAVHTAGSRAASLASVS